MVRGIGFWPAMDADDGATPATGASPDDVATADATTQAAVDVDEPAGGGEDEESADDADAEPLSAAELESEIAKLRRQSARRRIERNKAREELATARARVTELEAQVAAATQAAQPDPAKEANDRAALAELRALRVEVAGELGVPLGVLRAADAVTRAGDEAALRTALAALHTAIGAAAGQRAQETQTPANPTPPEQPSQPPSLREQIRQAEQEGTVKQRLALKSQQLAAVTR